MKVSAAAQRLHLGGVADRVDHVVVVGAEPLLDALGEHRGTELAAQAVAHVDQVLPRGRAAQTLEFFADLVGEGMKVEALGSEMIGRECLGRSRWYRLGQ